MAEIVGESLVRCERGRNRWTDESGMRKKGRNATEPMQRDRECHRVAETEIGIEGAEGG